MGRTRGRVAAALLIAVVAGVGLTGCGKAQRYDGPHTGCVVTGKDRSSDRHSDESDMRVYTKNCGTFQVGDLPYQGRYNSADTYGAIQVGHAYNFEAYGYRDGYTSQFPTIASAQEVSVK